LAIPFLITLVAFVWLFAILLSFLVEPKADLPRTRGRVGFAGFFGYVIVISVVGTALLGSAPEQSVRLTGWLTSEEVWPGALVVQVQTVSSIRVPLLFDRPIPLMLFASLSLTNASAVPLEGNVTIGFQGLDPPLFQPFPTRLVLNSSVDSGMLRFLIDPRGGVRPGTYNVTYFVGFDVAIAGIGTFNRLETGTLSISVQEAEFTSVWYLIFILIGILTSFWWRIANAYLSGGAAFPNFAKNRERRIVTCVLVIPAFSAVIALVIFGDFLRSLTPGADAFTRAVSGFFFSFFWENAAKKLGESVSGAYKKIVGTAPD